jgi:hypothetical protein
MSKYSRKPLNRIAEQKSLLREGKRLANVTSGISRGQSPFAFNGNVDIKAFAANEATNLRSKCNLASAADLLELAKM